MFITSLVLSALLAGPVGHVQDSRLAVIRPAPEFTLVNQDGSAVKMSDFKGKVVLVSFIFTTCNGSCPATTHRMEKIAELAKARNEAMKLSAEAPNLLSMEFLSITLDPARDTRETLRQYVKLYDLTTRWEGKWLGGSGTIPSAKSRFGWDFLTGSPDVVNKTIADWGMWVKPTTLGQLDHPSRIFLVDQQQRIREIYNVELLRAKDVLDDIAELLKETKK